MSDRNSGPPGITINEPVYQAPCFGLIRLGEAISRWPDKYRPFPPAVYGMLHPGSHVKVLVTSVGAVRTVEGIWLIVRQLSPARLIGKHIGEVRTYTDPVRAGYHGLGFGMMIYFQIPDIIDVYLNRVETS